MKILKKIAAYIALLTSISLSAQTYTLSDSLFRNFLKATYPTTINAAGDLVILEANKIKGNFTANGKNLSNVDGIQFFTGISKLSLQDNRLRFLPDLSPLTSLTGLNVSENRLVFVPSFSKLKRVRYIDLQKNDLVAFPDVIGADSLQQIFLHFNSLDSLPDLSSLKMLKELNVQYNNIRDISGVENAIALEILIVYKNKISKSVNLSKLTKLQTLNIGYNALKIAPIIGANKRIKIMYANDNLIDSLPDNYALCDSMENIRLYNNPLTFKDLAKFMDTKGYDTLVKLNPQPPFKVGFDLNVRENINATLKTGIDAGVLYVTYEWFKNGLFFKTTSSDGLVLAQVKSTDAGKYYCNIRHSAFRNFYIKTDTFNVSVSPCNDLSKIALSIADIECMRPGSVTVQDLNADATQNTYLLKSDVSTKTISAKNGKFSELTEPSYTFSIVAKDGCVKTWSTPISIGQQECEEVLLYPDSEGNSSYYFEQTGEVTIYDKRGNVVKKLAIPGAWSGQGVKGQKLPSGFYVADVNNGQKLIGITVLY
jgi:hypothetical protein